MKKTHLQKLGFFSWYFRTQIGQNTDATREIKTRTRQGAAPSHQAITRVPWRTNSPNPSPILKWKHHVCELPWGGRHVRNRGCL
jgi:hypothetical protein